MVVLTYHIVTVASTSSGKHKIVLPSYKDDMDAAKWKLILYYLVLLTIVEAIALYSIKKSVVTPSNKQMYYIVSIIFYGLGVSYFLYKLTEIEGIGMVNFLWNIFSTLSGFLIGIYLFSEEAAMLQWIGVGLGFLALGLIILGDSKKQ